MIRRHVAVVMLLAATLLSAQDADQDLRAKLVTLRVDANFELTPLPEVVDFVRDLTGCNVIIDTRAIETPAEHQVTLRLRNVRVDHLLDWIARSRQIAWTVRDGVVLFTGTDSNAVTRSELRLYDVRDLLTRPRDFPAKEEEQTDGFTQEDLLELVKDLIDAGSWDSYDRSIQSTQNNIVALCPPEVHAKIEGLLSAMRYLANFTVTCEARVVDLAPGALEGAPTLGSLAAGKAILSKEEAASLLSQPAGSVAVVEAVRFTCVNGQRMHVVLSRSQQGVHGTSPQSFESLVEQWTAETVIEVLPVLAVGREAVYIDLDARLADAPVPPERLATPQGSIELGRWGRRQVRTSVSVPNGGGVLLALGAEKDRVRALLLRVTSNAQPLTVTPPPAAEVKPSDDAAKKVWERFRATPMSISLEDVKLEEFVRRLQESGEINCVLDPVLTEDGTTERDIRLRVTDVPGEMIVKLVTQMLGIGYAFRDEALFFARPDRVEESVLQVYDVRDLLWTLRDYPGPVFDSEETTGSRFEETEDQVACCGEEMVETIKRNIEPSSWEEAADVTRITMLSGALFVLQRPSAHEKIREFLEAVRTTPTRQVHVDARVIELDAAVHDGLDAGGGGALPDATRQAIERALASGQGRVAAIWSMVGLNGQRFHATSLSQREYVGDYDVVGDPKEVDPVYTTLSWGHGLDVRATLPSVEEGSLSVELHVQCCDAADPLPTRKAGDWTVQVPSVDKATLHTTVLPEAGRAWLFTLGSSASSGSDRRRALVLTVREAK